MVGDWEPVASDASAPPVDSVPPALLAEWRAAEERLYPMVMVIPEAYERVVRLVGEATVELQLSCPDVAALVAAAPDMASRIRRLAIEGEGTDRLDLPLIAGAACLMRYRQLEAENRRDQRRHRIATAIEAGAVWVTLSEGATPSTWPALPSPTLEMHVASGRALEQTTTIDLATGAAHFVLSEIPLDPLTGEVTSGVTAEEEFDDLASWRSAIAKRREFIEQNH